MNIYSEFEMGFWHPFGKHGGEEPEEIIKRKREEIKNVGWTLWSFQFRNTNSWVEEIVKTGTSNILVFCSDGKGTKDPKSKVKFCNYYAPVNKTEHIKIPSCIKVPHPMGNKTKGSAFIVKNIIYPVTQENIQLQWFYASKKIWQDHRSSTFGEHLIKKGGGKSIGKFQVILELQTPHLAEVGIDEQFTDL